MLAEFLKDYLPIIVFLIVALVFSVAFVAVNYLASPKNPDPEKLSAYECGFEPFNDCLLYTSPSPRDRQKSRMPSSA